MSRVLTLTMTALFVALAQTPALADRTGSVTCFGSRNAVSCFGTSRDGPPSVHVRNIPEPKSEQDKAESAQRERLWVARCRPRMTVDELGMQRYAYAAAGCEFGKYQ
jgi:hypothetical protein